LCQSESDRVIQLLDDITEGTRDVEDDDLPHGMRGDRRPLRRGGALWRACCLDESAGGQCRDLGLLR